MKYFKYTLFYLFFSCQAQQGFFYREIPSQYQNLYKDTRTERDITLKKLQNAVNVKSLLPRNYDVTGSTDYTAIFQKALDLNREIIIPRGVFLINKKGLTIPSFRKVYFEDNAVLQMAGNDLIRYEILRIHDVENVEIYYANISGDRATHTGKTGEWGFGISIQDSNNIFLYKPIVKNCWGDGIFVGSEGKIVSQNIKIEGGLVDNNRRNGISVTSAINLLISNVVAANSNGTFPKAGIDFEPSHNWEFMQNVKVNNIITYNNEEDGLLIVLVRLKALQAKQVSINIDQHTDYYSRFGMALMLEDKKILGKLPGGFINITNVNYRNTREGNIRNYSLTSDNNIKVTIDQLKTFDKNKPMISNEVTPNNFILRKVDR